MVGQLSHDNFAANLENDVTLLLIELAMTNGCTALSTEFKTTDLESELRCGQAQQTETHFDPIQYTSHVPDVLYPSPVRGQ